MVLYLNATVSFSVYFKNKQIFKEKNKFLYCYSYYLLLDAQCVSLGENKHDGLSVVRLNKDSKLVPFKENVTIQCNNPGRHLRRTASSGFRQCVYDPKQVTISIFTKN